MKQLTNIETKLPYKISTGFKNLDNVLNGGFVGGAVLLFAGTQGAGKSTLLLQIAGKVSGSGQTVLYITGEENLSQIKQRADRLGVKNEKILVHEGTEIEEILEVIEQSQAQLVIVDSMQVIRSEKSKRAIGTPTQMKLCLEELIETAKATNRAMVVVGHATKDGYIAGLNTLQHMVDATMFMSINRDDLRTIEIKKNRYGKSFIEWAGKMTSKGLVEVRKFVAGAQNYQTPSGDFFPNLTEILFTMVLAPFFIFTYIIIGTYKAFTGELPKGGDKT